MYTTESGIVVLGNNPHETEMSAQRDPSEDFIEKLRAFDPRLYVCWNKRKERWVIEECLEHHGSGTNQGHTHLCRRSYVWLVRNPDDSYLELCDRVIDEVRGMDVIRKYGSMENMMKVMAEMTEADEAKYKADVRDDVRHASRDNRRQLNELQMLVERTDMAAPIIY